MFLTGRLHDQNVDQPQASLQHKILLLFNLSTGTTSTYTEPLSSTEVGKTGFGISWAKRLEAEMLRGDFTDTAPVYQVCVCVCGKSCDD